MRAIQFNKKLIAVILLLSLILLLFPGTTALADYTADTYVFPSKLLEIEESAFEGTGVSIIVFPDGFLKIGDNAFANTVSLQDVFIPQTTCYIADTGFPKMKNYTIHGKWKSYALEWAEKHTVPHDTACDRSIPPIIKKLWRLQAIVTSLLGCVISPDMIRKIILTAEDKDKSRRPQDRPELNPIDYRFP